VIGQADNLSPLEAIFAANLSHVSEHSEKLRRLVAPGLPRPSDSEQSSIKGPHGIVFDKDGGRFVCRLGHSFTLHVRGFGSNDCAEKLTLFNPIVTGLAA
jgi:hypothetical protein